MRKYRFGSDFKVVFHHYTLKEELTIQRQAAGDGNDLVTMFFYRHEQPVEIAYNQDPSVRFSQRDHSAIQVTSNDLSSSIRFPAHHTIHYVVVGVRAARLKALLAESTQHPVLDTITRSGSSFLYYERMDADTKWLLKKLEEIDMNEPLSDFYLQVKVQELLYLLFRTLALRGHRTYQSLSSADVERLLQVRDALLRELSVPPVLRELAQTAAMSETKLKRLFKQTFGTTIYSYYQRARMEEAAFLLKQAHYSVAETGHALGFTNLSHFSRLFKQHYGVNPKRYSTS
ncbi:helix-turn-helix transcriptional regulator [Catalinimonas alkaloidigena]|uniref:helix-turn-helix transcriptional regulator n=1 Tax=Catalinimonas alkaloidigena TaxID=1075417 RepID=UPI001FDF2A2E|nr:AraC family transcriptional regulator [Catalinimonas alkaloidigena]